MYLLLNTTNIKKIVKNVRIRIPFFKYLGINITTDIIQYFKCLGGHHNIFKILLINIMLILLMHSREDTI
jgi:hypothetical protein